MNEKRLSNVINELQEEWEKIDKIEKPVFPEKDKITKDTIYGIIKLDKPELFLTDLPPMQRLRGVSHLGLINLVYPGANHTRFEHSLGVAYIVEQALKQIRLNIKNEVNITDNDVLSAKVAALLHDVGHLPFSHASESLIEKAGVLTEASQLGVQPHEYISKCIVECDYFSRAFDEINRRTKYNLEAEDIANYIIGKTKDSKKKFVAELINGTVDADKIDYLTRDAHYTGVPHGRVDIGYLINTLTITRMMKEYRLVGERKGLESIESLLTSRELMFPTVYTHHTVVIARSMLTRAIFYAFKDDVENEGLDYVLNLLKFDDKSLLSFLYLHGGYPTEIVSRIKYRRLFKRALTIGRRNFVNRAVIMDFAKKYKNLKEAIVDENEIANNAGLDNGYVIIDVEELPPVYKETRFPIKFDGEIRLLDQLPTMISGLGERRREKWKAYVLAISDYKEKVKKEAAELFAEKGFELQVFS